ncbi:MAG: hypothetical protein HRT89_23760 [Lentisphaeria bacterium]|nr:hypothetical protein [Lentisphaeria bacterium]NQZ71075.1 hypothetical protein [Lentisphaeria bacterium]
MNEKKETTSGGGHNPIAFVLPAVFAIGGCIIGAVLTWFLLRQGIDSLVFIGLFCGLAAGRALKFKSKNFGFFCAVLGLFASLLTEAYLSPFIADGSLLFFFTHLQDLSFATWIMAGLGSYMAYSYGKA